MERIWTIKSCINCCSVSTVYHLELDRLLPGEISNSRRRIGIEGALESIYKIQFHKKKEDEDREKIGLCRSCARFLTSIYRNHDQLKGLRRATSYLEKKFKKLDSIIACRPLSPYNCQNDDDDDISIICSSFPTSMATPVQDPNTWTASSVLGPMNCKDDDNHLVTTPTQGETQSGEEIIGDVQNCFHDHDYFAVVDPKGPVTKEYSSFLPQRQENVKTYEPPARSSTTTKEDSAQSRTQLDSRKSNNNRVNLDTLKSLPVPEKDSFQLPVNDDPEIIAIMKPTRTTTPAKINKDSSRMENGDIEIKLEILDCQGCLKKFTSQDNLDAHHKICHLQRKNYPRLSRALLSSNPSQMKKVKIGKYLKLPPTFNLKPGERAVLTKVAMTKTPGCQTPATGPQRVVEKTALDFVCQIDESQTRQQDTNFSPSQNMENDSPPCSPPEIIDVDFPARQKGPSISAPLSTKKYPGVKTSFRCPRCKEILPSHETWRDHMFTHYKPQKKNIPRTTQTNKETFGERNRQEMIQQDDTATGQPDQEDQGLDSFENIDQPDDYLSTVSNVKSPYHCDHCNKDFILRSNFDSHQCRQCSRPKGKYEVQCPVCNLAFRSVKVLEVHARQHAEPQHTCGICQKPFFSHSALLVHADRLHEGRTQKPLERVLQICPCAQCGKIFTSIGALKTHEKTHRNFKCSTCRKRFETEATLDAHLPQCLSYDCPHCPRKFAIPSRLREHVSIHTGETPHSCTLCNKSFRIKHSLMLHMRRHQNDRAIHPCPHENCDKKYVNPTSLKIHLNTHAGIKPFLCSECGRSYTQRHMLKCHVMRAHSGNLPFPCLQCHRRYPLKSCLALHVRDVHGERNFMCETCGHTFRSKARLTQHNQRTHIRKLLKIIKTCQICGASFKQGSTLKKHMKKHEEPPEAEPEEVQVEETEYEYEEESNDVEEDEYDDESNDAQEEEEDEYSEESQY